MNNQPIIINIGRQIGSGGGQIAKMLAKDFDCQALRQGTTQPCSQGEWLQ